MPNPLLLALAAGLASPTMVAPLSSPLNDYNAVADAAESILVVARSEAEFRNARILVSHRTADGWSPPEPIGFSDPRWSDSDPWLTADGQTLYFISNRPAAGRAPDRHDLDIWRARRNGEGWSEPEHLGAGVNSDSEELGPELHDGRLYFASTRPGGRGGLDIYQADVADTAFGPARPLESPFNSRESESDFTLSPDGQTAMFWRIAGGKGLLHVSRRRGGSWSEPQPLPASINLGDFNFTPSFSADGRHLRFASTMRRSGQAAGLADIYEAEMPQD
ncbi:TolB family protein [Sphingosinicella terrae]|uniref:TolB family protein n=1 Tax=Sphingosinicella terrae TaxID=2172047 RepID=UPI000E0D98FA|nr:sialidase family protein [Sphingosinicella terrae]